MLYPASREAEVFESTIWGLAIPLGGAIVLVVAKLLELF